MLSLRSGLLLKTHPSQSTVCSRSLKRTRHDDENRENLAEVCVTPFLANGGQVKRISHLADDIAPTKYFTRCMSVLHGSHEIPVLPCTDSTASLTVAGTAPASENAERLCHHGNLESTHLHVFLFVACTWVAIPPKRMPWRPEEDVLLTELVLKFGARKWQRFAHMLSNRYVIEHIPKYKVIHPDCMPETVAEAPSSVVSVGIITFAPTCRTYLGQEKRMSTSSLYIQPLGTSGG